MEIITPINKVPDFILGLDTKTAAKVHGIIERLGREGHELKMPHSKSLGAGLFELRVKGNPQIRIMYAYHRDKGILLNIFFKKTWAIPRAEIEYARKVLRTYLA